MKSNPPVVIPAFRPHVVLIRNVEPLGIRLPVHVCQIILAVHPTAVQSAWSVPSVRQTKPASMKNVAIHV